MKAALPYILILVLVFNTLCSCSTETVEQVPMLKSIVEISLDGSSTTTSLRYNANKIVSIDMADTFLEFQYSENFITKIIETNKISSQKNTLDYTYVNGVLSKITSSAHYEIIYKSNKDGTISYEKWSKDATNLAVRDYYGTLVFQNENLVKIEKTVEDKQKKMLLTTTVNCAFDNQKNALRNILGFDKLLDFSNSISLNNCILSTQSTTEKYLDDNQIVSSIKRWDSKIQYNSDGYPTEIVSEKGFFGQANAKHLKSQLFYN
ncbi:hypothetical protein [Flavobacterium nackdongense]|uniref:DUF4595 domain-containing protein n=1 Tax=Flavobacterium nackdongense TaxID=2547394 RepID=A0A4V1AGN3_9FLAO|nr:hypothetical protein [Flavobacterium nackdongense]QBN18642.1 hypothetical protein E1750_07400 [Flavobacterium nackdongense]